MKFVIIILLFVVSCNNPIKFSETDCNQTKKIETASSAKNDSDDDIIINRLAILDSIYVYFDSKSLSPKMQKDSSIIFIYDGCTHIISIVDYNKLVITRVVNYPKNITTSSINKAIQTSMENYGVSFTYSRTTSLDGKVLVFTTCYLESNPHYKQIIGFLVKDLKLGANRFLEIISEK